MAIERPATPGARGRAGPGFPALRRLAVPPVPEPAAGPPARPEPAHHHSVQILPAPHVDAAGEAVRIEEFEQRRKAVGVPVVGGGRQEQPVLEAAAEIPHRARELRFDPVPAPMAGSRVMSLVEDQQASG